MSHTILLYGATGYSGRLIAEEAKRQGLDDRGASPFRLLLGGRDGRTLAQLSAQHDMETRVFSLENRQGVTRALADVDVVINAAGPFALTGNHLARGALTAGCHYVDINGEADVYMKLDDLGRHAVQRGLAMVCGAGHTAAASDLLLNAALNELPNAADSKELGAIRIAMSRILTLSRGSLETLWRSLREQVTVVRLAEVKDGQGGFKKAQVLFHEPTGRLERVFDFGNDNAPEARLRIASAANLVDTLTARLTVERNECSVHSIESYVETGLVERTAYQIGTLLAPLTAIPLVQDLARLPISALPAGPSPAELKSEGNTIVLEIDDRFHSRIIDWRWHTPNPYVFTARVVLEVAQRVGSQSGWLTPSAVLNMSKSQLTSGAEFLRGCRLEERVRAAA